MVTKCDEIRCFTVFFVWNFAAVLRSASLLRGAQLRLNPDGVAAGRTRTNLDSVDLNRPRKGPKRIAVSFFLKRGLEEICEEINVSWWLGNQDRRAECLKAPPWWCRSRDQRSPTCASGRESQKDSSCFLLCLGFLLFGISRQIGSEKRSPFFLRRKEKEGSSWPLWTSTAIPRDELRNPLSLSVFLNVESIWHVEVPKVNKQQTKVMFFFLLTFSDPWRTHSSSKPLSTDDPSRGAVGSLQLPMATTQTVWSHSWQAGEFRSTESLVKPNPTNMSVMCSSKWQFMKLFRHISKSFSFLTSRSGTFSGHRCSTLRGLVEQRRGHKTLWPKEICCFFGLLGIVVLMFSFRGFFGGFNPEILVVLGSFLFSKETELVFFGFNPGTIFLLLKKMFCRYFFWQFFWNSPPWDDTDLHSFMILPGSHYISCFRVS